MNRLVLIHPAQLSGFSQHKKMQKKSNINCDLRDLRAQIGYFYENGYLNNLANYHYSKNGQFPHPPCFHFLWNCFSVTFALRIKKELLTKTYYHGLIWYFFFGREARGECEISQLAQLSRPGWQPKHTHTHTHHADARAGRQHRRIEPVLSSVWRLPHSGPGRMDRLFAQCLVLVLT